MSNNQYEDDQRSMEREVRADQKKGLKVGCLKTNALLVIATTPEIRFFLLQNDPAALNQVELALGKDRPTKEKFPVTFRKVAQMEKAARAQEERHDEASPYPK